MRLTGQDGAPEAREPASSKRTGAEAPSSLGRKSGRLLSVLGVGFGLAVVIGNTIGAGILASPGLVAELLPSMWLFFGAWLVGALYAFGGANALCELATMIPRSGGQYHFARRALGHYAGFVVGWCDWLGTAGSATAVAIVLAESVAVLVPGLAGFETPIAAATVILFTVLLLGGVREGARLQTATSLVKAIAFLFLIGACVVFVAGHGPAAAAAADVPDGVWVVGAFIVALQSVIYTFDGWTGAIYFTEEVKDPGRDIPRATFGGLAGITGIYLALMVAFVLVVPLGELAGSPLAAGDVAARLFGARGDFVLRLIVVLALLSTVNALIPMSSRVLYAMGTDRLAPGWATRVSAGGAPRNALLASGAVSLLFLLTGTFAQVVAILSFFFVAAYAVSFTAVFVLRWREPEAARPWRAWGHPWTTAVMLVGSLAFLAGAVVSDLDSGLIAVGLVLVSYPIFRVVSRVF
ncbi:MAG TPA: APC family permease [Gemmatimonadaceae bacterium]|nr:APC family permease [Gemmatimonadaceae bacterium]